MTRVDDLRAFYDILDELATRTGTRRLCECNAATGWPARGVYFFFEDGERRSSSGAAPRVVRVGTHALTPASSTSLWKRLSQHRGVESSGGGNHRGSVFRLLVGEALARRDEILAPTWGCGNSLGEAARRHGLERDAVSALERPLEARVSRIIGAMPFVWIAVDDEPNPDSLRGVVERNSIGLLSNAARPAVDPSSPAWLGHHSGRDRVRDSGLWNNNHVHERYDPAFLQVLRRLARDTHRCVS